MGNLRAQAQAQASHHGGSNGEEYLDGFSAHPFFRRTTSGECL